MQCKDNLFCELHDTCTTLLAKIDESTGPPLRLQHCETLITTFITQLEDVECSRDTIVAHIATLQAFIAAIYTAPRSTALTTPAVCVEISDIMHELDMRASKKSKLC